MARMLHLLSLAVEHEFFIGTSAPAWQFEPTATCRDLMQQYRLALRPEADGISLWRQSDAELDPVLAALAKPHRLQFEFQVSCADPWLDFYTDWPDLPPVCFANASAAPDGAVPALLVPISNKDTWPDRKTGQVHLTQPYFIVQINISEPGLWNDLMLQQSISKTSVIRLAAKKIFWKYYLSGNLAGKQVEIVDLDGNNSFLDEIQSKQGSTVFEVSQQTATEAGAAWISKHPIPMRQLPQQRFQLREEGSGAKVLVKRLPNANCRQIGKEIGADGQIRYCAEIYINQ